MHDDLTRLRQEYTLGGLDESDLAAGPVAMLRRWLAEAASAGLYEPTAMVLCTLSGEGPSVRTVLLKGLDDGGLVFFTNYASRKGEELAVRPECAVVFPWHELQRQVRVEGTASRLTDEENAAYFASRPRASQLGAWASPQSQVVPSRAVLDERYAEVAARFGDGEVPVPPFWGGYRIAPRLMEFWQGRRSRMHDRLQYRLADGAWLTERLAP